MPKKIPPQLTKICFQVSEYTNKFWRRKYFQPKIAFRILLGTTCALIVTFLGMAMDRANTNTSTAPTPVTSYKTSWIGNTIGNGKLRVQNHIEGMYVAADGTVYTNSHWDEAGGEASIYRDGKVIAVLDDTHGWNRTGGKAITANSKYIYMAMVQGGMANKEGYPAEGTNWYCVRRYDLTGKPAPFPGGNGWDKSMLIISSESEVTGLAISGNRLYVSNAAANRVSIYNPETMKETDGFSVTHP
jgi:hypothetical protein